MHSIAQSAELIEKDKVIGNHKKQLKHKDRALSETVALLDLSNKAEAIWEEALED